MKTWIAILLCIVLYYEYATSQSVDYYCAWESDSNAVRVPTNSSPCFDVESVFDSCTPVYIRINVHYFVKDDCEGLAQQTYLQQSELYDNTERMIKALNNQLEHNVPVKGSASQVAHCIPIRFVLSGVYQHCESNAIAEYSTLQLNTKYGIHRESEINFYVAAFPGGATGIGFSSENCGAASKFNLDDWWTLGNLYHELGHIFGLFHSFFNDNCDDTPIITYDWDKNCNGILEIFPDRKLNERSLTCWGILYPGVSPGEPGYNDGNSNSVNDCDENTPCTPCPCCKEEYIDNNVMSYSSDKSSLSDCQIRTMLKTISTGKCDLIQKIGGCPPTKAFIEQTPHEKMDQIACTECLTLEGSWDEEDYELEIYEQSGNQNNLVYTSGKVHEKAVRFCYKTSGKTSGNFLLLKPATNYLAHLTTYNTCSEDSYTYLFRTNNPHCGELPYESLDISPNPVTGNLTVQCTGRSIPESVDISIRNIQSSNSEILPPGSILSISSGSLVLDFRELNSGVYVLMIQSEECIFQGQFVKL